MSEEAPVDAREAKKIEPQESGDVLTEAQRRARERFGWKPLDDKTAEKIVNAFLDELSHDPWYLNTVFENYLQKKIQYQKLEAQAEKSLQNLVAIAEEKLKKENTEFEQKQKALLASAEAGGCQDKGRPLGRAEKLNEPPMIRTRSLFERINCLGEQLFELNEGMNVTKSLIDMEGQRIRQSIQRELEKPTAVNNLSAQVPHSLGGLNGEPRCWHFTTPRRRPSGSQVPLPQKCRHRNSF